MKNITDPKLSAGLWTLVGIVTAPNLLFIVGWARFQSEVPDRDSYTFAYSLSLLVTGYLLFYAFRRIRTFGDRDFAWTANQAKVFPRFALVFVLEATTQIIWYLSDWVGGLFDNIGPSVIYYGDWYQIEFEQATYIALLVFTLPFATWLIRAYLDFLQSWISAALSFWNTSGKSEKAEPETAATPDAEPEAGESNDGHGSFNSYHDIEQQIETNISRATMKGYFAMLGMALTVIAAIIGFQYVFQSSATTRATQLIQEIENSPIALSSSFSDRTRNLKRIAEDLRRANRSGVVIVEDGETEFAKHFRAVDGTRTEIDPYLNSSIEALQTVGDTGDEMGAELKSFLARLSLLRTELADTSRMNWDIILVRTAIILLALVAVKIFHTVMMSENRERHHWEARLVALKATQSGSLSEANINNYLAIVGKAPENRVEEDIVLPDIDVNKLAQKIAEVLTKKRG